MRDVHCENCGRVVIRMAAGSKIMTGLVITILSCPKCEAHGCPATSLNDDATVEQLKRIFNMNPYSKI